MASSAVEPAEAMLAIEVRNDQVLPPGGLYDRAASTSFIAALPEDTRDEALADVKRYEDEAESRSCCRTRRSCSRTADAAEAALHWERPRARRGLSTPGRADAYHHRGAMARGDVRIAVTLACDDCKRRNYQTEKSKRNDPGRIEMRKYCRWCGKHTGHRETR